MSRAPWTGTEESVPLGAECSDCDRPFVIRDVDGKIILTLYEDYGPNLEPKHVKLGQRIVAAINLAETVGHEDLFTIANAVSTPNYVSAVTPKTEAKT